LLPPLILLAASDEWFLASLESVLRQGGYRVAPADNAELALEQAHRQPPDAIILDFALGDYAVCRALRAHPSVSRAAAIIITSAGPVLRAQRLDALRAGAWEMWGEPLDTEELLLRLSGYVEGKLEADRAGLVDRASGLYNAAGIARRSAELASFTARQGLPLACAVFQPAEPLGTAAADDRLALAFKTAGRTSDAIGRTGPEEFAVFAPATDAPGVARLVNRISHNLADALMVKLRAGVSTSPATAPQHQPPVSPEDLLQRARSALR
jgi:PleD family two-component response regulator